MVAVAGELLYEASAGTRRTPDTLKALAHHLGRLYGETIRTCRGYDGLKEEVTTTFMCGMALEPNFGREDMVVCHRCGGDPKHLMGGDGRGYCSVCDNEGKIEEEKTPGQLLYEGQPRPQHRRPWAQLPDDIRRAFEQEVMTRAEAAKTPGQLLYEKQVEECGEDCPPWKLLDCVTMENLERDAKAERAAKACSKCTGTGNMSLLGEYEKCDAC